MGEKTFNAGRRRFLTTSAAALASSEDDATGANGRRERASLIQRYVLPPDITT